MKSPICVMAIVAIAVSVANADPPQALRFDGIGKLKIGMSLQELNEALNEHFTLPTDKHDQPCFCVTAKTRPHLGFMIEKGRLTRIDVHGPQVATSRGIRVGDSEAKAKAAYGKKLTVEPHAYTGPEGHYLTVLSADGKYGIRFETDGKKITSFYAGNAKAIRYIEGCL